MPYKEGGGGKSEPYNPENGQYSSNSRCEEDKSRLIVAKLFGVGSNKPIPFPEYGIHDEEYCDYVISYCLRTRFPTIHMEKLTGYLLVYKRKNDKSKFLEKLGYTVEDADELYNQIIKGTSFQKKKLKRFDSFVLSFNTETKIMNRYTKEYYLCTTSWAVEKDFSVRFITLIPEVFKK